MRYSVRSLIIFVLLFTFQCFSESQSTVFTFEELVDSAYKYSGIVQNSTIELDKSYNKTKEIRSSLFPTVSLFGNAGRYFRSYDHYYNDSWLSFVERYKSDGNFGQGFGSTGDLYLSHLLDQSVQNRSFAPKNRYMEFGISINQPILLQGRGVSDIKLSKVESSLLVCHWQEVRMHVKTDIAKLYFAYLRTQNYASLDKKIILSTEEKHRIATASYNNGESLAIDTLSTFLDLAQAQDNLAETERNHRDAEQALKRATGISSEAPFAIDTELSPLTYDIPYEDALQKLTETNKQITTLRGEQDLASLLVERSRKSFLPRMSIGADISRLSDFNEYSAIDLQPERTVHLDFSYDLTTAGKRWFNLLQAKQHEEIVKNSLNDMIRDRTNELKKQWSEWETTKQRLARLEQAIEAAENYTKLSSIQFTNGTLARSKQNEISLKTYELKKSYIDLVCKHNCLVIDIRLLTADYIYN